MVAEVHTPLVNTTRYHVLCVKLVCVIELTAFVANVCAIGEPTFVHVELFVDFCHWIVPTVPDAKVNVALLVPVHTEAVPVIAFVITIGLIVTV